MIRKGNEMKVETQTEYHISITKEEEKIIDDFYGMVESIRNTMEKYDCTILEWSDSGSQISIDRLEDIIDDLETLSYVDTMF